MAKNKHKIFASYRNNRNNNINNSYYKILGVNKEISYNDLLKKYENYFSISNLVEKPIYSEAPSNLTVVGRYLLNSKVFDYLSLQKKGYGNEIQLTDSLVQLTDAPGLYGIEFNGKRFDCGSKFGFIEANINFGLNDLEIKKNLKKILRDI